MNNDTAFGFFAAFIVAGTATVITASILGMGGSFPPLGYLVEHFALSCLFRSAYKSLDGSNWILSALQWGGLLGVSDADASEHSSSTAAA
jgi:hypothetical protein